MKQNRHIRKNTGRNPDFNMSDVKLSCDHLATVHQNSGQIATRFGGKETGTAIYVTRDPQIIQSFDCALGLATIARLRRNDEVV